MSLQKTIKKVKTGIVESVDDPTFSGRIKVRVDGLHDNIPTESLPWCNFGGSAVFSGNGGGQISIPRVGTKVRVRFASDDINSMEWYGTNMIDRKLAEELAADYEGAQVLLYDSDNDLSIKFQQQSGLSLYYKGSSIQIDNNNNITLSRGHESGIQIQLNENGINILSAKQINITSNEDIKLDAQNIILDAKNSVKIKGDAAGNSAVNGQALITLLELLAEKIDEKLPNSSGLASSIVMGNQPKIINQKINYI